MMCRRLEETEELLRSEESAEDLRIFREHARNCPGCHSILAHAALRALVDEVAIRGGHLEPETLSYYLDHELPPSASQLVEIHIESCHKCRERMEAMQSGRDKAAGQVIQLSYQPVGVDPTLHRRKKVHVLVPVTAAAAFLFVVVFILNNRRHSSRPDTVRLAGRPGKTSDHHLKTVPERRTAIAKRPVNGKKDESHPVASAVQSKGSNVMQFADRLVDGGIRLIRHDGVVQIEGATTAQEKMIRDKLGRDGTPVLLAALNDSSPLRGPLNSDPVKVKITSPLPREVFDVPRVNVRWEAATDGGEFRIIVHRERTKEAEIERDEPYRLLTTDRASITLENLEHGEQYTILIRTMDGETGSGEVPFGIMNSTEAEELHDQLVNYKQSHLLRGILYEKNRLYSQAMAEYQALLHGNPRSRLAKLMHRQLAEDLGLMAVRSERQ